MPLPAALLYVPILFAGLATSLQALAQALEVLTGQAAPGAPTTAGKIL
jgi:hypothetical protein